MARRGDRRDPDIQIAGPPGLVMTREPQYDDTTHLKVDFTPALPGPLTFTATWTQLTAVTLDPLNIPKAGARASSRLARVRAGPYADEPFVCALRSRRRRHAPEA
ncbi:MAG: hypothetical protein ACXVFQ_24600 [Solirubrobacteraceae bacterium]